MFYAMADIMPPSILLTLYHSLVYSALTQSIIIWGHVSKIHRDAIQTIMNKILRIILKVKYNDIHIPLMSTNTMYKKLRLLKFNDVYQSIILVTVLSIHQIPTTYYL